MSASTRIAVVVAVLISAVAGFWIARPQQAESPVAPASTATERPAALPVPTVRVRGGEAVGGIERVSLRSGERARLRVVSDQADEIHIHGYDITRALPASRPVTLVFPARLEGVFEVELHGSGTQIAELTVSP